MNLKIFLAVITIFLTAGVCLSEDEAPVEASVEKDVYYLFVGEKTWQSNGDNEWNIAGSMDGGPPNILSELEYLGVASMVYEINGGLRAGEGEIAVTYGVGSMSGGIYRDSDYSMDGRQGIFSLSTGSADGALQEWNSLQYWTIDYSYKLFKDKEKESNERYISILMGYQDYREKIRMTNGVQEICESPKCDQNETPLGPFTKRLDSTYEFNWKNYRIGLEGGMKIYKWFSLKEKAVLIPYTEYSGEGIWNLRSDFRQSPSFQHKANGGYGFQNETSLGFNIYNSFTVELGYRYWFLKSGKGTDKTFFLNGAVGVTKLNEAVSKRDGFFLNISYAF